jgi:hypothetical protein
VSVPLGTLLAIAFLLFRIMDLSTKSAKVGEGLLGVTISALSGLTILHALFLAAHVVSTRTSPTALRIVKRLRLGLTILTLLSVVVAPTVAGMYLRTTAPERLGAVCNDVVLADEEAADALLNGTNPYSATFDRGSFAAWHGRKPGDDWYRYIYGPVTFLLAAPLQASSQSLLGWYDNRVLYLLCYCVTVAIATLLGRGFENRLALMTVAGLAPITSTGPIIGYNDFIPLVWLVGSVYLVTRGRSSAAGVMLGLALASKLTVLFALIPFAAYRLGQATTGSHRPTRVKLVLMLVLPLLVMALVYAPFAVWDLDSLTRAQLTEMTNRAASQVFHLGLDNWGGHYLIAAVASAFPLAGRIPMMLLALVGALGLTGAWVVVIRRHPSPAYLLLAPATVGLVTMYCSAEFRPHHLAFFVVLLLLGVVQSTESHDAVG